MEAYSHIIEGTQGTEGSKRLAAQYGLESMGARSEQPQITNSNHGGHLANQELQLFVPFEQIYSGVFQALSHSSLEGY
jgi:hypothetical protein